MNVRTLIIRLNPDDVVPEVGDPVVLADGTIIGRIIEVYPPRFVYGHIAEARVLAEIFN